MIIDGGGRKVGENKALTSKKSRYSPYTKEFGKCRICKTSVHQVGSHYCQACAYKKGEEPDTYTVKLNSHEAGYLLDSKLSPDFYPKLPPDPVLYYVCRTHL